MTIQTAVLIETLVDLGADVRWASLQHLLDPGPRRRRDRRSRHAGVRVEGRDARGILGLHARRGHLPGRQGPAAGRRRRRRRHAADPQGLRARERQRLGEHPVRSATKSRSSRTCSRSVTPRTPRLLARTSSRTGSGVSEETTTGVHRLYQMQRGRASCWCRRSTSTTRSPSRKFDNLYGCRESLADGIKRATDVMIAGKVAVVCGYGDVGKGSAHSLRGLRRPRHRHRDRPDQRAAGRDGRLRSHHDRRARSAAATSTSPPPATCDIITLEHMQQMKDQAIVCNIGHFDNEIQVDRLNDAAGREAASTSSRRSTSTRFAERQRDLPARRRPPGEPRLRHRPPELRDVQLLHQPDARAARPLDEQGHLQDRRLHACRRSSTKKSPACTSRRSA